MISRAGPSAAYPGGVSAVVSGSQVQDAGGQGDVTLVTEPGPAAKKQQGGWGKDRLEATVHELKCLCWYSVYRVE